MNEKKWIWAVCFTVFLVLNASASHAQKAPNACVTCHEALGGTLAKPVTEWKGSIHSLAGVTCERCHGGNAKIAVGNLKKLTQSQIAALQSASMSKADGFVGTPSGRKLFNMCEKCHSYEVGTFSASIMGKAYLHDKGGPACVVCHHAHRNTIPQIPKVCSKCHRDTVGFTHIDPMNVTVATIKQLSNIRIKLAREKTQGARPSMAPRINQKLGSYQVGLIAFGAVLFLFLFGFVIYVIFEKGDGK